MSDNSYPSDAVNVLAIQNGIAHTLMTSLTSLVSRTQLARPKTKGPPQIFKQKVKKQGENKGHRDFKSTCVKGIQLGTT